MTKKILISFNNYLQEFVEKLHIMIPQEELIKTIKNTFHLGKMYDEELYIKHFYENITTKFHNNIIKKDEKFFIEYDFSLIPLDIINTNIQEANKFKNMWQTKLSNEYKEIIWQYMKVLSTLSLKFFS